MRRGVLFRKWLVEKMERAKGFEPSTAKLEVINGKSVRNASPEGYTQIRAQETEEDDRLRVFAAWHKLPPKIRKSIVLLVEASVEEEEEP